MYGTVPRHTLEVPWTGRVGARLLGSARGSSVLASLSDATGLKGVIIQC